MDFGKALVFFRGLIFAHMLRVQRSERKLSSRAGVYREANQATATVELHEFICRSRQVPDVSYYTDPLYFGS